MGNWPMVSQDNFWLGLYQVVLAEGVEEDFVAGIRVPSFQCPTCIQASKTVLSQVLLFCVYPSDLLGQKLQENYSSHVTGDNKLCCG